MPFGSHRPRKRFGQHFLHEKGVLEKLLDAIQPAATDFIVEIGPGEGALTEYLKGVQALHLIELDRDLAARLTEQFPQATIHSGDALEFDFAQFPAGMRIAFAGGRSFPWWRLLPTLLARWLARRRAPRHAPPQRPWALVEPHLQSFKCKPTQGGRFYIGSGRVKGAGP